VVKKDLIGLMDTQAGDLQIDTSGFVTIHAVDSGASKILPGLRIPFGSSACFNVFINDISAALRECCKYSRLNKPIPCSAEMMP